MRYAALFSLALVLLLLGGCAEKTTEQQQEDTTAQENDKPSEARSPNVIFVMVDDLGYGDLGCFGQQVLNTPNLDRMAEEGMRFTNCYAGSPVCAPSRSTLMTGMHTGHTTVRGNKAPKEVPVPEEVSPNPRRVPLNDSDITVAEVMKAAGYVTGMFGKWGLGEDGSEGEPNEQGFDEWLGFLNQHRAHDHFPDYFWKNQDTFFLEGNDPKWDQANNTFSHNLFTEYALDFVDRNQDTSFFLYLPYCLPHDHFHLKKEDSGRFEGKDWTANEKIYATFVQMIDDDMGKLFSSLKEKGIEENTLVFFCSDNGAAHRWDGTFNSSGILRGRKRDLYEGGIRTPMIVRMPGTVPKGTSDYPWYFPDVLPTLAAFAKAPTEAMPKNIDGINVLPELLGEPMGESERFFYWEFHEGGYFQAARWKNWKAVRKDKDGKLELYDLSKDPSEETDISADKPEIVAKLKDYLDTERSENRYWKPL